MVLTTQEPPIIYTKTVDELPDIYRNDEREVGKRSIALARKEKVVTPKWPESFPDPSLVPRLQQLVWGKATTQCLFVASKLGIADLLADGPRSVEELAAETETSAGALYRVLRLLASLDVFVEVAPRQFALTPMAELLQADAPCSFRDYAIVHGSEWYNRAWAHLLYSVEKDEPAFDLACGLSLFEFMEDHPDAARDFNNSMTALSRFEAAGVCAAYDFSDCGTVVDVGGGHGRLLTDVLAAYPSLSGILFDQPSVVDAARPDLESSAIGARCRVVGGDFFENVPAGGDVYLLKHIIHDWDDERSAVILRNCREAMNNGGRVLVVEGVMPPGNEPSNSKLWDVVMLALTSGGRERTEAEYAELYAQAGLTLARVVPTSAVVSIVEGTAA